MSILWVTVAIAAFGLVVGAIIMSGSEPEPEKVVEESYSDKMARERKEREEEEKQKFMDSIREPVFSFLKVFKENPKRFKLKCNSIPKKETDEVVVGLLLDFGGCKEYSLIDLETGEEFKFNHYRTRLNKYQVPVSMLTHNWLERNELTHLYQEIRKHYAERQLRKDVILFKRRDRVLLKERNRLTEIYGGESEQHNNQA